MGHRIRIIVLVVAVLLIAPVASAKGHGRVVGQVLHYTGAVLSGVAIDLVVHKTELTTTTDGSGPAISLWCAGRPPASSRFDCSNSGDPGGWSA